MKDDNNYMSRPIVDIIRFSSESMVVVLYRIGMVMSQWMSRSMNLLCLFSSHNNTWDNYGVGVIHTTIKRYLLYKRKLLELCFVQNLEVCARNLLF